MLLHLTLSSFDKAWCSSHFWLQTLNGCSRGGTKTKLGGKCSERHGDLCKVMIRQENDEKVMGEQVQIRH